jgi:large subunit ribosomal protein L23
MNQERVYQIIRRPHISEKTAGLADKQRQITFEVLLTDNKDEIKAAVEQLFKVEVDKVRTIVLKGKSKRFGKNMGQRKNWKKAYVLLKEGHDIDFIGMAS